MEKLILLTALLSAPTIADDSCSQFYGLGETIMKSRQNGVPLPTMMGVVNDADKDLKSILKEVVVNAYSQPRYNSKDLQIKVINEFANDLYVECLKSV